MNNVYVVVGRDRYTKAEWFVAAYPDEESANQHATLLNLAASQVHDAGPAALIKKTREIKKTLDANALFGHSGQDYFVRSAPFVRHVDEYKERLLE